MKKENRLLTIDGETLMSQPLTPLNFVVDTLISQGLHILAGSPKVGKSWLALWLAVTVAKGEAVWGMGVKQGTTLYLCLEDSTLRIQNRLFEITEDAPANVHFSTNSDTLGKGLEEQLCAFLSEHPDTVLVIIDTLQMIRGAGYDNTYANDYRDLSALKHIADNPGITVTELARHNGKTKGAISQILKKIEDKGLICRGESKGENKCPLFLTEKGKSLDQAHRQFDEEHSGESINQVRKFYSDKEINLAFDVLETWLSVRREVQQRRIQQKKEARKKQKTMEIKEVRLSPNIDTNDLNTKVNQARKFLTHGDKVKVTLRFRGRELAHVEQTKGILDEFAEKLSDIAVIDKPAKFEGRSMIMFLTEKR